MVKQGKSGGVRAMRRPACRGSPTTSAHFYTTLSSPFFTHLNVLDRAKAHLRQGSLQEVQHVLQGRGGARAGRGSVGASWAALCGSRPGLAAAAMLLPGPGRTCCAEKTAMVNDLRSAGARALECPAAGCPASPPFQSGWPLARDTVAVTPRSIVGKRQVFHSKAVGGRRGALKGGGGRG